MMSPSGSTHRETSWNRTRTIHYIRNRNSCAGSQRRMHVDVCMHVVACMYIKVCMKLWMYVCMFVWICVYMYVLFESVSGSNNRESAKHITPKTQKLNQRHCSMLQNNVGKVMAACAQGALLFFPIITPVPSTPASAQRDSTVNTLHCPLCNIAQGHRLSFCNGGAPCFADSRLILLETD